MLRASGEKIQEIPLRHEGNEFGASRDVLEIGPLECEAAECAASRSNLAIRQLQEIVEQTEFVQDLHRRRMNGVAAKIPQEIAMFLEDGNPHPGVHEQIA